MGITIISIRYREIRWPAVFSRKTESVAVFKLSLSSQVSFENLSCLRKSVGINAFISDTIRFTVHGRVRCGPLLSLLIDKPNVEEFNAFVDELKQRARQEYNAFAGLKAGSLPAGLAANVFEEPPEFDESRQNRIEKIVKPVSVENIDNAILMLERYMDAEEIKPFLTALKALKAEPEDESYFGQLVTAFDDLGPRQGAVLTYAPYVSILLSDDPFGF